MEEADRLMKETRAMRKWRRLLPKRSILGEIDNLILEKPPPKTKKTSKALPESELPPTKRLKQDFFAKKEPTTVESASDNSEPKPVPLPATGKADVAKKAPAEKPKKVNGKKPIPVMKGQMRITAFMRV